MWILAWTKYPLSKFSTFISVIGALTRYAGVMCLFSGLIPGALICIPIGIGLHFCAEAIAKKKAAKVTGKAKTVNAANPAPAAAKAATPTPAPAAAKAATPTPAPAATKAAAPTPAPAAIVNTPQPASKPVQNPAPSAATPSSTATDDKMKCSKCGALIAATNKFCTQCGNTLVVEEPVQTTCARCGANVESGSKFCSECGYEIK